LLRPTTFCVLLGHVVDISVGAYSCPSLLAGEGRIGLMSAARTWATPIPPRQARRSSGSRPSQAERR
jgi:hypothetical protein